jgi:hypothetical protein
MKGGLWDHLQIDTVKLDLDAFNNLKPGTEKEG